MWLPGIMQVRFLLLLLLACGWQGARAETEIRMLQSFIGKVNFVGTQKTIRNKGNNKACEVFAPSVERTADLTGIPSTATILAAHLYWAGSGTDPDYTVTLDGEEVKAAGDRQYYSTTIGNNYNYFAGAADVTEQVRKKRNAQYSFRGLTVDYNAPYCAVEGVLGGFSLLVIYSDETQPFRLLNLYEGFRFMRYTGITLNLSGFRVPDPIGLATGRIGHITWEGDATLDSTGEDLKFNDVDMTDARNSRGNQFNSQSSINGDDKSYGIDFDAYTVGSPVIKPGDTTATTRYETGQDLVLLNAEIVALPNVPLADLVIDMTRNNEMALGQTVGYTITVANKGPSPATTPTVITNTLPPELAFVSAAGAGWTCTVAGQEVKCTNTDTVASGASFPPLTITATVVAKGTITNSATVTGKVFDPELANNTASATGTVGDGTGYVLTNAACADGLPFGHPNQPCSIALGAVKAGADAVIFITAVSGGVPAKLSADKPTTVKVSLALSCILPARDAGVKAWYAGVELNPCAPDGNEPTDWSALQGITIPAGSPSVAATFRYGDVGRVQLYVKAEGSVTSGSALPFVSAPYKLLLSPTDGSVFATAPLDGTAPAFKKAGQAFGLAAGSYNLQNELTPNFGAEGATFALPAVEKGATAAASAAMVNMPGLQGSFGLVAGGKAVGSNFRWDEVGVIKLTPRLSPELYLGEVVTGTPAYVGRFYPDHFVTAATQMDCVANMKCDNVDVRTAAYSKQPLSVRVTAHAAGGAPTQNYQGAFARELQLSAWANPKLESRKLSDLADAPVLPATFDKGMALAHPVFTLPDGFTYTKPQSAWTAPTPVFIRAVEGAGEAVTSDSASHAHEVGIQMLSGRLLVPNAHGSERLNLPLKVNAQYWTGSNWELSKTDSHSLVDPASPLVSFSNFKGLLTAGSLSLLPSAVQQLSGGAANLSVKDIPALAGSADLLIDHLPWLPSTRGRLKFGTYRSPLIYLREVH